MWEVVAVAADPTGLIIREGQELTSEKVEERLTLGAKVKELDLQGERLRFQLIAGRGPPTGWATVKVRDKDLLRRTNWRPSSHLADDHFIRCGPPESGCELANPQPDKMKEIYLRPLEFIVQPRQISVHKAPSTKAAVVGKLMRDEKVLGFPQGSWLKLRDAPGGWALLGPPDDPALHPSGAKLEVSRVVAEAAVLRWEKVPAKAVQYNVEWANSDDMKDVTVGVDRETKTTVRMRGLPPEAELKGRLVVRILTEDEAVGGKVFATLRGEWEDMETERAVDEVEESNNCIDNFSNFRGKCMDCPCEVFVMAGVQEQQCNHMQFEELLCRRCACPCVRHTIIGELVVNWHRRKPGVTAEKPQASKPQPSKPFQPPPRAQAALPSPKPEAASWKESDFKRWRPEDAGDGDRVKFVLDHIAQATTLYETLGVAPSSEEKQIRSAYRHISLHIHPDKVQNRGEKDLVEQAEAAFKIVCSAYDMLNDPGQRASYDRSIRVLAKPTIVAKTSRTDLTGMSFLKKFLGKMKNNNFDLKQKPKGDWEDEGGGVYVRAVGVKATIRHVVSGEELVLKRLDKGISLNMLKKLIVREMKRGPESRIELSKEDGTEITDTYRVSQSETFILVGISLGPPVEVEVCLCHAHTGARLKLKVLDTASMAEVRAKAAEALEVSAGELRLGCRASNKERFQPFEDEELLNGREQLLLLGVEIQMILTVEEATELQAELRDSYGAEWFQKQLDSMLEECPLPECLSSRGFGEQFAELVKRAQQAILVKHGFDGPKGVFNMYAAFKEVGGHPDVVKLTWEIDQQLRITSGGRMWISVPLTLEACPCICVTLEASVLVRVALESCFSWSDQPPLHLVVPAQSTVGQVHEAAAKRLDAQADELQLVHGEEFEPYDLSQPIGGVRTFKVLGKDLPQDEEDPPLDARWEGYGQVLGEGEPWAPSWMEVKLPAQSAVGRVREALGWRLGIEAAYAARFAWGESFEAPAEEELLTSSCRLRVFGVALPEAEAPKSLDAAGLGRAEGGDQKPRSMKVSVLSHGCLRDVREAAAKKLGVELDTVQLLHLDGVQACNDAEPVGGHRRLKILGVDLPEGDQ